MKNNFGTWLLLAVIGTTYIKAENTIGNDCLVQLPNGGQLKGNCDPDNYRAFTNIPFARPPIGNLRFESPQPAQPWQGIREAVSAPIVCTQFYQGLKTISGDEDCLYLNIYVPKTNNYSGKNKLKVILWIYPGAFTFGGPDNNPDLVMEGGQYIWINFGYRLGPLGFISTNDMRIPGNNGLKDQRLAIDWTYENIAAFGGDPKSILLLGASAGAVSVQYHMITGTKRISAFAALSGSVLNRWALRFKPETQAEILGQKVNCSIKIQGNDFKNCLKKVKIENLWTATIEMHEFYGFDPAIFRPTKESTNVSDAFLTEYPEILIREGRNSDKPLLVGVIKGEGNYGAANLMQRNEFGVEVVEQLNEMKVWLEICPLLFFYKDTKTSIEQIRICKNLKRHYMCGKKFNLASYRHLETMFSDEYFYNDIFRSVAAFRAVGQKVYLAYADLPLRYSLTNVFSVDRMDLCFGSSHVNDVFQIFPAPMDIPPNPIIPGQDETIQQIIRMFESVLSERGPSYNGTALPVNIDDNKPSQCLYYTYGAHWVDKCRNQQVDCQREDSVVCKEQNFSNYSSQIIK